MSEAEVRELQPFSYYYTQTEHFQSILHMLIINPGKCILSEVITLTQSVMK
jgi:hypothetical protein